MTTKEVKEAVTAPLVKWAAIVMCVLALVSLGATSAATDATQTSEIQALEKQSDRVVEAVEGMGAVLLEISQRLTRIETTLDIEGE